MTTKANVKLKTEDDTERLINSLRESFLVHSYLYYKLNKNLVPDNLFDARAKYLLQLHRENPEISENCIYQDYFVNYDPATGYDIPVDDWIIEKAQNRIDDYESKQGVLS